MLESSSTLAPSVKEPGHPLKLIPIPELKADLTNYDAWKHAVWFHICYYDLVDYVDGFAESPRRTGLSFTQKEWDTWRHDSQHAYAIIACKIQRILPGFKKAFGRSLYAHSDIPPDPSGVEGNGIYRYEPDEIWNDVHRYHRFRIKEKKRAWRALRNGTTVEERTSGDAGWGGRRVNKFVSSTLMTRA